MQTINTKNLKEKLNNNEDFVLINALHEDDYREKHIPGSINIPYDDDRLEAKVTKKTQSKNDEIIVY